MQQTLKAPIDPKRPAAFGAGIFIVLIFAPSGELAAMTAREITLMGNPALAARAVEVANPAAPEIHALADDMIATMRAAGGIGIAAPQVGEGLRLIVALPLASREDGRDIEPLVLVNPVLQPDGAERDEDIEGCLSIPGLRGIVPRWSRITWKAQDLNGETIGGVAQGLFARILQHEVDHLDGILFLSRMPDITRLAMTSEAHHLTQPAAKAGAMAGGQDKLPRPSDDREH